MTKSPAPCTTCGGEYEQRQQRTCEVVEDDAVCAGPHYGRGMCAKHYQRARKHGSATTLIRGAHVAFVRRAAWMETDDCIIPPWFTGKRCVVKVDGIRRTASRLAWIERHGDPGARLVLHSGGPDNGAGCINVRHLRIGSADTTRARDETNRAVRTAAFGENHGHAKLTRAQVREIRRLAASGVSHRALAADLPVSRTTVSDIVNRRIWAWLDAPE